MITPKELVGLLPPTFDPDYVDGAVVPYLLSGQYVGERPALPLIDLALSKSGYGLPDGLVSGAQMGGAWLPGGCGRSGPSCGHRGASRIRFGRLAAERPMMPRWTARASPSTGGSRSQRRP
jgi:hypothetical protein